ncbi:MAG: glycosyltransferase family 4 protein, partial [Candidatus Micrarchaeota archaeon]
MRYCFVNYSFVGTVDSFAVKGRRPIGGGEVYLLDLCKLLQRRGHETAVVQGGKTEERFEYEGIEVAQVRSRGRYYFNLDWRRGVPKDAERVHLHDANHACPYATARNTATFHGVSWDVPFEGGGPAAYAKWKARSEFFQFLIRYAVRKCKRIVSVDTVLKRYVEERMPRYAGKITVIPNYVDLRTFKPAKPKKTGKKVILLPRNLTRNRGIDIMLDAFSLLGRKDAELWVAGTGPLQPLVEGAARRNPAIKFLGHKDHYRDLPGLYNRADIVVVPSRGVEGTSLSVLEAMACGKPVVASRVGGIPDIITDGRDG